MRLIFSDKAWDDYLFWQKNDRDIVDRINQLIKDTMPSPFVGIGKPEPLRREMQGFWSRRINQEHRIVYRVTGSGGSLSLELASCRFRYEN